MKLITQPDHFAVHTFRQSWLKTYFDCPEQARLVMTDQYPSDQTEAAASGTAVHAAIQAVIEECAAPEDAVQRGLDSFGKLTELEGFRWVKVKRPSTCRSHIQAGFASWYRRIYPTLGATVWCEHQFKFKFYEDQDREIWLSGTVDYADANGLKDWKLTGNRDKYGRDAWKLKRWDLQSTVYAAAAIDAGLFEDEVPFEFVALSPQGHEPQRVTLTRNRGHVEFLKEQCLSIAVDIEAQKPRWPLRDQHALCSPDWCLHYSECKGRFVGKPTTPQK